MEKVSLIMTTYNNIGHLETTLESVKEQDYPNIEVIICDGGSTDGTLSVIKKYAKMPEMNILWKSEKDNGIYDAMNKGFQMSTGDIIAFFNDVYCREDVITKSVQAMHCECCDGSHGDLIYSNGRKIIRQWHMGPGRISQGWMPGHPTLFLYRKIFEKYGLFRTDYKVSADYEFMVRILKDEKVRLAYVPVIMVKMYYGGTSTKGIQGYLISLKEGHRALKENKVKGAFIIDIKRTLRVLKQFNH